MNDGPRNRLGEEKSPYLLQHKDNPVHWYAWGEEAFAAAKARDVPIFLSVGYSTCHWCHVMEHESFEDDEVAGVLNDGFVAIKVDREERPDIDAIYMDAVQRMRGSGGWPMTVFLTHDAKPFFGGTYFPKQNLLALLGQVSNAWVSDRDRIRQSGQALATAIENESAQQRAGRLDASIFGAFLDQWVQRFDARYGGRRGRPKFPSAADMRVLLRIHRRSGDERALEIVNTTLDRMARGGIYDHLGGGFHRYSVDERWLVPHFEKMLYDQATLTAAYLDAWEATGRDEYALVVREICDYVLRDMTHPDGGFYSAEDADSEGEEGKFYVWTEAELKTLLDAEELPLVTRTFGVTSGGNFEHGTTILTLREGSSRAKRSDVLTRAMAKLLDVRDKRIRPHLDDKILTDWNGMMIASMARAGRELGDERYVKGAARAARFMLSNMRTDDGRLLHRWREGEAKIRAFLDDYAYVVDGLIELYQADFDVAWLDAARTLQAIQDRDFGGAAEGSDYFTTDGRDGTVILRRVEPFDNVRPAGRSTTAANLLRLADLTLETSYATRAAALFAATPSAAERAPTAFADLLLALDYALDRSKEIALVGDPASAEIRALLDALRSGFLPNQVIAAGLDVEGTAGVPLLAAKPLKNGAATAYVCENGSCRLPTNDPAKARELAATFRPLTFGPEEPAPEAPPTL